MAQHDTAQEQQAASSSLSRERLQKETLKPNSGAFATSEGRILAWLELLHIETELQDPPNAVVKEEPGTHIGVGEDGWQTFSDGQVQDEWIVAKSKKSRRASTNDHRPASMTSPNPSDGARTPTTSRPKAKKKKKRGSGQMSAGSLHKDSEQVDKDVERSFVGPAFRNMFSSDSESLPKSKAYRREQLSDLVMSTLCSHPALSYFQGYHDIISVVLLTFDPAGPEPDQPLSNTLKLARRATERVSLHIIRDSMSSDLQPVLGQLKILRNLLRACDAQMAELAERASALPFFALPWLLTLFTHDVDDVAVSQCILDFVFAHGPASAMYLCAAVILAKKEDVTSQDPDELDDPAMLHCLLAKLPAIYIVKDPPPAQMPADEAVYTDPDVELPSLASDRAIASALADMSLDPRHEQIGVSLESLLHTAAQLMHQYPLDSDAVQAFKIMGQKSVLTTWPNLFGTQTTDINWKQQDDFAESILRGPSDAIVVDPHPDLVSNPEQDEKESGRQRPGAGVVQHSTAMLAIVSISGLLVAALCAQSASKFTSDSSTDAKQVLTLIVSLLSQWGRVVGGATTT